MKTITDKMYAALPDKKQLTQEKVNVTESFSYSPRKELIKETNALGLSKTYAYDLDGRLIQTLDEDNAKINYSYDKNNNVIAKTIAHPLAGAMDSLITTRYDKMNRTIKRVDAIYSKLDGGGLTPKEYVYSYDAVGKLLKETDFEGKSTSFEYDANGNVTKIKYPDKVTEVAYNYDAMNRVASVEDEDGISTYSYDERGLRTSLDIANKTKEVYTYDKKGRTLKQVSTDKRDAKMTVHDYDYDANDNIVLDVFTDYKTSQIKEIKVKSYAYDALNQLTLEKLKKDNYEQNGTVDSYYYDTLGNRVQRESGKLQTVSQTIFGAVSDKEVTTYWYNAENQLMMQKGIKDTIAHFKSDSFTFEYDKRGNLNRIKSADSYIAQYYYDGTNKLRYSTDRENKLTRYNYDGLGRRLKKVSESDPNLADCSGVCSSKNKTFIEDRIMIRGSKLDLDTKWTQNFVYNPLSAYDDVLITYGKNVHTQRFVYGANDKDKGLIKIDSYDVATDCFNDKSYFGCDCDPDPDAPYAEDVLNSKIKKASRYVIKDIRGSIELTTCDTGCKDKVFEYSAFGELKTGISVNDIHGYAGYVNDKETSTNYINARNYMPSIGKFLAKDVLRVDSLNRYLYVLNDPVNAIDLNGLYYIQLVENKDGKATYRLVQDSWLEMVGKTTINMIDITPGVFSNWLALNYEKENGYIGGTSKTSQITGEESFENLLKDNFEEQVIEQLETAALYYGLKKTAKYLGPASTIISTCFEFADVSSNYFDEKLMFDIINEFGVKTEFKSVDELILTVEALSGFINYNQNYFLDEFYNFRTLYLFDKDSFEGTKGLFFKTSPEDRINKIVSEFKSDFSTALRNDLNFAFDIGDISTNLGMDKFEYRDSQADLLRTTLLAYADRKQKIEEFVLILNKMSN